MRLQALLSLAFVVPLCACGGGDDDAPLIGCVALVACLDECAEGDTACEHECHARGVSGSVSAATSLRACIDESNCAANDEACIEEACGSELVVCGAIVGTGETDGGTNQNDGGEPTKVTVTAVYHRQDEPITAFVVADVTDTFDFEIPWPLTNGSADPNNHETSNDAYVDTRGGCLTPTADNALELFQVTAVEVIGASVGVTSMKSVPAITRGVGEGDCAVDSTVDPSQNGDNSFAMSFPLEFFTTTPHGTYTVVDGYWTFTFVVD